MKSEAEKLIDSGIRDPREMEVPYALEEISGKERQVLEMNGLDPGKYTALRLEIQRLSLREGPQGSWVTVDAILPTQILAIQKATIVSPDGSSPAAAKFQSAMGPCELRVCLRHDAFAGGVQLGFPNLERDPDEEVFPPIVPDHQFEEEEE